MAYSFSLSLKELILYLQVSSLVAKVSPRELEECTSGQLVSPGLFDYKMKTVEILLLTLPGTQKAK